MLGVEAERLHRLEGNMGRVESCYAHCHPRYVLSTASASLAVDSIAKTRYLAALRMTGDEDAFNVLHPPS